MFLKLFYVICVSLIVLWTFFRLKYRNTLQQLKNMDELENIPIFGSLHLFIGKSPAEIYKQVLYHILRVGSPCKIWFMTKLVVSVRYSDDIQRILSSPFCYEKGTPYRILLNTNGLITAKPNVWRIHRKLLNSSFHVSLLENFFQQFNDVSKRLVADLSCKVGDSSFDIQPYVGYRMVDLQLKTIFDSNVDDKETQIIYKNNKTIIENWGNKILKSYTNFIFILFMKFFKTDRFEQNLMENSMNQMEPIIEKARQRYYEKLKIINDKTEDNVKNKPEVFIHKVIRLVEEKCFTEQQKQDHITTMLLAGTDTLTVSVSNCILLLAMNPDAQSNCIKEIRDVMGEHFETLNKDDLTKLNLLDRTVNECLRLLPTIQLMMRVNEKDIELSNNHVIPAGTDILIPIVCVHHCKEYWGENPTKFDPDHFLPENVAKRPLLSYIPFSYGLRNCIARKYANDALKTIIAHLVMNYKFSTDLTFEQLKLVMSVTAILQNKYMIRIEKRS